jgi:putative flippase GtrA
MSEGSDRLHVRVLSQLRRPEVSRFLRYSTVSAVSSCVSLVGLYVFYRVIGIKPAALANVFATAVATIPSYYLNRTWAWKRAGKSHLWREVVPFWVIAFISLGLSTGAVALAESIATSHHFSHQGTTLIVEFANFFTYGVLWVGKYLFFNRVLFAHRSDASNELTVEAVAS